MGLAEFKEIISISQGIVTIIAIITGGFWSYILFIKRRENAYNWSLDATANFNNYRENLKLLTVDITLKNIGRVKLIPSKKGCWFSLRYLSTECMVDDTPHWNDAVPIIEEYDVIRKANPRITGPIEKNYWIEPGAQYVETINVVISEGLILMAEIGFESKNEELFWIYKIWKVP